MLIRNGPISHSGRTTQASVFQYTGDTAFRNHIQQNRPHEKNTANTPLVGTVHLVISGMHRRYEITKAYLFVLNVNQI